MKINVGSKNQVKVGAVAQTLQEYPRLKSAVVAGIDVNVEEFGHPKNMAEIFQCALNRAKKAFVDCELSIGLESGLVAVPGSESGYMEISGCVVYDGNRSYMGLSTAFEWPLKVTEFILAGKGDGSLGFREMGYTDSTKKGAETGGIASLLTDGRITREDQIRESLVMALIYFEKPEYR